MSKRKNHNYVAYVFKRDFIPSLLPIKWQNSNIITESTETKATKAVGGGLVFAYKYGVLVFYDVKPEERIAEVEELKAALQLESLDIIASEELVVEEKPQEKPAVKSNKLIIDQLTPERIAAIAQLLAQSTAMEYYERVVNETKKKVIDLTQRLQEHGKINLRPKVIYKIIAEALLMRNEVIGVLHLLDRPDIIWDDPVMDRLYGELRVYFDLNDRFKSLEYKLQTLHDTLTPISDTVKDSRLYRAEIAIVGLFLVSIALEVLALILKM